MADLSSYINITANTVTTANLSATGNVSSNSVISTTGNITGAAGIFNDGLSVTGNITASGNLNYQNVNDLVVGDPLIYIGANNTSNLLDLGIVASANVSGIFQHLGIVRNHATGVWGVFGNVVEEPTTVVDWANAVYQPFQSGSATFAGANINGAVTGATTISASGNIAGSYFIGNGAALTGITVSGSNPVSTTGNVAGGNLIATGTVSASGNITANYFFGNVALANGFPAAYGNSNVTTLLSNLGSNTISGTGNITTTANISGNYILGNGSQLTGLPATYGDSNVTTLLSAFGSNAVSTTGNITAGNIIAANLGNIASINLDGNASTVLYGNGVFAAVAGGGTYGDSNVNTLLAAWGSNTISTTGNITSGYLFGNGSQLTGLPATYGNSNVATLLSAFGSNTVSTTGTVTAGNITSGNVLTGGVISATSNVTGGNIRTSGLITATGNITGGNVLTGGSISSTGNATVANLITAGSSGNIFGANNVSANSFTATYAPGSTTGSGILSQGANTQGGSGYYDFLKATNQSGGATNTNKTFRLNSTGGFEIINSNYTSTLFSIADNGNAVVQGNLQVTGTLTYVNTTNLSVTNALITLANAATTPAQANGGGIQLNGANANIIYTNGNDSWNINKPIVVTGVASATGTVTGGNLATSGTASATGNITGGNVLTAGAVSAVGNITGSYIIGNGALLTGVTAYTNANVSAFLAAYGSNTISTTGTITSGNITGSNILTGGVISATGNITGSNILTGGVISATGNITGGNISATNHTGTTVSVTGNITAGNIINTGISSVTGNITGGNVLTAGQVSAIGNITTANSFVGNLVGTTASVTGNVTAGNVIANNIIVNGQQTNYGVVTPAYMVVGLANSIGSFGNGSTVIFDTVVGNTNSQTSYNASTGVFTLTAGVTYDMSFTPSLISFTNLTGGFLCYDWVDATTNALLDTTGIGTGTSIPMTETSGQNDNMTARVIYTPTTNQTVKLRVNNGSGTATLRGGIGTQAIIKPLNPTIAVTANPVGFRATTPVTNVSVNNGASATMLFGTEEVDTNSAYNPATGRFTPNAAGYYSIDWFIVTSANGANELLVTLNKNGTDIAWGTNVVNATAHWNGVGGSAGMIYLNGTTDYILVKLTNNSGSTATVYSGSLSFFSAYLIR